MHKAIAQTVEYIIEHVPNSFLKELKQPPKVGSRLLVYTALIEKALVWATELDNLNQETRENMAKKVVLNGLGTAKKLAGL